MKVEVNKMFVGTVKMFQESRNSVVVQLSWFSVALSAGAKRFFSQ